MSDEDEVEVTGVTIGRDSASGMATHVFFPSIEDWLWVPISITLRMTRTKIKGNDKIVLPAWYIRKNCIDA